MIPSVQPALLLSTPLVPANSTDFSLDSGSGLNANPLPSRLSTLSASQGLGAASVTVATGLGLLGQYFDNSDLTNLKLTRTDPTINFSWIGGESPGMEIAPTTFSVRWTGAVEAEYSESYTFYTASDDGVRLWVNGQELINNWTDHGSTEDSGTINLVAGQKYDIKVEYYQANGGARAQLLWSSSSQPKSVIPQSRLYEPDRTLPTADLPPSVSDAVTGAATYGFTVLYSDLTGVNRSTIDNQDVVVTGPNNFSQLATLVSVSSNNNASSLTATYQIKAPGGVWNANNVGLYSIALQGGEVSDVDGNSIPSGTLGTFRANVTPPKASLGLLFPVVQGTTNYGFRVGYEGQTSINRSTIDNQDILVTGPNNFSQVAQFGSFFSNSNGTSLTASYVINAPGGVWDATDGGTYTFTLQANQVGDTSNNFISATTLGTVQVDFALPTATLAALTPATIGSAKYSFSVTYRDDTAVQLDTINDQDIIVSGPNNFRQLAKLVSVSGAGNGSPLTAIYSIDAPGGVWDVADQGSYTLTLQNNQISDTNNNFAPTSVLGALRVDFAPPIAKLTSANLAVVDAADYSFTVLYQDDTAVKRSTIANQNISVTGPNKFSQLATLVSVNSASDAGFLIATYRISAPGGAWDSADTGTYTIALQANQISDLDGNFTPASVLGSIVVDLTPPTADLTAPTVIKGQRNSSFKVVYRDGTGIKRSTIDSQDLLIRGPKNFSQLAKLVTISSDDDQTVLATYSFDAPNGVWDSADTGAYTITLQGNQISDINNNFLPASVLGTLQVNLPINDFNGDGKTDVLWYDRRTREVELWLMNGVQPPEAKIIGTNSLGWAIEHIGDFNGDGKLDLLWRKNSGEVAIWLLDGAKLLEAVTLPALVPSDWSSTIGDLNGDGKSDLFWRKNSGEVAVWLFDGAKLLEAVTLPYLVSSDWRATIGDLNGDGKSDLFWHKNTGEVAVWLFDGAKLLDAVTLPSLVPSDWRATIGDLNGDGKSDLFWRKNTGEVAVWLFDGVKLLSAAALPSLSPEFSATLGDLNGDSKTDVLWYNPSTRDAKLWLLDSTQIASATDYTRDSDWTIVNLAIFN